MVKIIPQNTIKNQSFSGGYKTVTSSSGEVLGYALKKKEFNAVDTFSFITAITSMIGFAVGGSGLFSDFLNDLKNKKAKSNGKKDDSVVANGNKNDKDSKKEGAKTIVPGTKFSKIGLLFAKVGIAFSGIAGIFNGISMGLPLMAAGEALNLGASPIIETPLGTGLFGIALAAVFSGRALENDPKLRLDKVKLANKKGFGEKAKYVLQNTLDCAKEVAKSGAELGKQFIKLFSSDSSTRSTARSFFKDGMFSIKPKKLVMQEWVNKEGVTTVKTVFKNNPYLMHAASIVLALGGATLAISSLTDNKLGQKIGLKTYETGGSLDNLSLSRWGCEKAVTASTPSAKLAGNLLGLSGVTILAGQPGVDEKWGRGIQWLGTALLFAVFAVERKANAFKVLKHKPELKSLMRQWEVDLTKLLSKDELKAELPQIIKAVKGEEETVVKNGVKVKQKVEMKNQKVNTLVQAFESKVQNKPYLENSKVLYDEMISDLNKSNALHSKRSLRTVFKKEDNENVLAETIDLLKKESDRIFIKNAS